MLVGSFFELFEGRSLKRERTKWTHACASISNLMKKRTRAESVKTPDSWKALRDASSESMGRAQLLLALLLLFPAAVVAVAANDNIAAINATLVAAVAAAATAFIAAVTAA